MNRELIMATLYARLIAPPLVFAFTADLLTGDPTLYNVSDTSGLFVGMPIGGKGLKAGAVLGSLDPVPSLSLPPNIGGIAVALTQGFQSTGRRLVPLSEMTNLPALFLVEGNESYPGMASGHPHRQSNTPALITLEPYLWLYAKTDDPIAVPNSIVNVLLDGVDQALEPPRNQDGWPLQNLGLKGVVHARVEGKTLRAPGSAGAVNCRVQLSVLVAQGPQTRPL
jgi:hypothetical protein